jgi:hypothetical protein
MEAICMKRALLAIVCLTGLGPAMATAQDVSSPQSTTERAQARQKVRSACAADVQKFCANIEHVKGAMRTCLDQNQASLSPDCSAARAERAALKAKAKS